PYQQVLFANIVLAELENFSEEEKQATDWKELKGAALFYRAYAYFGLARAFCLPYDRTTAEGELGLVLRTSPDIDSPLPRANLEETFDRILNDLTASRELLADLPAVNTRPSKAAAYAMLSRVYLYQGDFAGSLENAELALGIFSTLIDYNSVDPSPSRPFVGNFGEVIYYSEVFSQLFYFYFSGSAISPDLIDQYGDGDLRKELYYYPRDGFMAYRGQYSYLVNPFGGLAVDELLLNKAEAEARLGEESEALNSLNQLLEKRFIPESFEPLSGLNGEELINTILVERRKELVLRGIRWGDIKRLNVLGADITLKRTINGEEILLPAGDLRFALPIPQKEIGRSGIQQNRYE
ncbi:RagB/SusD family nutrient uptake outer membrane protein, partial [Algoriphagus resistens]|uniref:RagB/SusD family nutrient uptake outer membrane protein n=1 Tax=Algoriphagus resistens TaxID=1750590 RepID=UPI0007168326